LLKSAGPAARKPKVAFSTTCCGSHAIEQADEVILRVVVVAANVEACFNIPRSLSVPLCAGYFLRYSSMYFFWISTGNVSIV
jgi:hypothetical protein